jgi:hypothetical protein
MTATMSSLMARSLGVTGAAATGGQKPLSWSCWSKPVLSKYLQKKSFGIDSYRQKSVPLASLCDRTGRPARSVAGHVNVSPVVVLVVLVEEVVEELVEELVDELVEELVDELLVELVPLTQTVAVASDDAGGQPV